MDGHSTHTFNENIDFCRLNKIDACFFPAHTSHLIQPLDVGIFNAYKAGFRKANGDPSLSDIDFDWTSAATRNRVKVLGRSLIAFTGAATKGKVKRAFLNTGIYPNSFHKFIAHCKGVTDVPDEFREEVKTVLDMEKSLKKSRIQAEGRINIENIPLLVQASEEV